MRQGQSVIPGLAASIPIIGDTKKVTGVAPRKSARWVRSVAAASGGRQPMNAIPNVASRPSSRKSATMRCILLAPLIDDAACSSGAE